MKHFKIFTYVYFKFSMNKYAPALFELQSQKLINIKK